MKRVAVTAVATGLLLLGSTGPVYSQEPATEPAAEKTAEASEGEDASAAAECPTPEPPVTDRPGLERLLLELRERHEALAQREAELDERERSVVDLEAEAARRLAELDTLREAIETRVAAIEAQGDESISRLSKVYAAMPPGRAAPLLESLEPSLATAILRRMKHKKSAAVLAVMAEPHALRLSRRVARPLASAAGADDDARTAR